MIAAILNKLAPWLRFWPVALALIAFGAGWTVNGWRHEASQAAELQAAIDARLKAEQIANEMSAELEQTLAAERKKAGAIARRLDAETHDATYRCPVPANGVRLLREVVTGGDTAR